MLFLPAAWLSLRDPIRRPAGVLRQYLSPKIFCRLGEMRLFLLALPFLAGCFFYAGPNPFSGGSVWCVPEITKVGSKATLPDGRTGTVTKVYGRDARCTDDLRPVHVDIEVK
jgi:hypothetical protein